MRQSYEKNKAKSMIVCLCQDECLKTGSMAERLKQLSRIDRQDDRLKTRSMAERLSNCNSHQFFFFFATPVFGKLNMPLNLSKLLKTTLKHNNGTY